MYPLIHSAEVINEKINRSKKVIAFSCVNKKSSTINAEGFLSLAKQLVYLSGHMLKMDESSAQESSIEIQYTGLQKGEKIHEELFIGDNITSTEHPMILEAQEELCTWIKIEKMLAELGSHLNLDEEKLRPLLMQYTMGSYTDKPTQPQ